MKNGRRSLSTLVIALTFALVLLIGYAATRRNVPFTNQPQVKQQRLSYKGSLMKTIPRIVSPKPSINPQKLMVVDQQKSEKIERNLRKMTELGQVGVIVTGNSALVGYSPSKTAKDVNSTKTLIANKVKHIDPSITHVVVSESADIMARMQKLTKDIASNRPGNEIGNEINRLLKSVAPVVK